MNTCRKILTDHGASAAEFLFLAAAGVLIGFAVSLFEALFGWGLILIQN
nr:hypothetical protein [uncultured Faecalibaculum sp.]